MFRLGVLRTVHNLLHAISVGLFAMVWGTGTLSTHMINPEIAGKEGHDVWIGRS